MLIPNNKALKDKLAKDEYELVLTLSNTTLTNQSIPNSKILQDSFSVNRFSVTGGTIEVGSATAAEMQVTIDNSDGSLDDWTFEGATIFARLKATISETAEYMDIGYFIVDEVVRQRDSIQLVCLDKMVWFDKAIVWSVEPNDGGFVFSTSPTTLLNNICSACNVSYNSASFTANAVNQSVTLAAPTSENLTYRQLLQWLCQVIGVCAYINESGALTVAWYAQKTYSGDDAEDRAAQDIITPSNRFSSTIDRDPVSISNVSVKVGETTYAANSNNTYTLAIEGNELINEDNYASILSSLATRLVGFSYYPFTADVLGLQWLQPLDITTFVDKDDVEHTVIITDWTYSRGRNTQLAGKGESATRKGYASNPPFTAAQQRIIEEIKKNTPEVQVDNKLTAVFALNDAVTNGKMLHSTTVDGVKYYHNASTLADSSFVAAVTDGGIGWTNNGWNSGNPTFEYGLNISQNKAEAILESLYATRVNADLINAGHISANYIDGGTLQIKDGNGNVVHSFSNVDGSASIGSGGITYNVNDGLHINSSVVIGAAQQAVEDVLSNQLVEYAISESGSTPPEDGEGMYLSVDWFWASSTNYQESDIYTIFSNASNWANGSQYRSGLYPSVGYTNWNSTNKYLYKFNRTEKSEGLFSIANVQKVATFGESSESVLIESMPYWYSKNTLDMPKSAIVNNIKDTTVSSYVAWSRSWSSEEKYLYYGLRNVYADGTVDVPEVTIYEYGSGSPSVVVASGQIWYCDTDNEVGATKAAYIDENINSVSNNRTGIEQYAKIDTKWTSSRPYLKSCTRTYYADGTSVVTDLKNEAVYGTSYPQFGENPWSTTMPSIADNKGKYLWTRTTIGENEPTYAVNYIGNDGVNGQDGQPGSPGATGNGVSSIVTKYAATATTTAPSSSSDWKDSPSQAQISASKPYLWTKTTTTYTNGTSSTTDPTIIGHYGKDGSSGEGTQGRGLSAIIPQYALATSNSTAPVTGWQDTIPEYPTTTAPTASGTLSSSLNSATTILTNLNLLAGTTYMFKAKLDKNGISGTRFDVKNSSGTAIAGFPMNGISTTEGTVTPSVSGVYHVTFTPKQEHTYEASLNGNDLTVKYYYWQRDKIEWDDGSADTYTDAILSTGFNAAIFNTNKLNPLFAEVYLNGATQVMFDAGHIYANSLTAYSVTAYEAFIKNLMANTVDVDGNITIHSSDYPTISDTTTENKNKAAQELYSVNYSDSSIQSNPVKLLKVNALAIRYQAVDLAKLDVVGQTERTMVFPSGVRVGDADSSTDYSFYGRGMGVRGNAIIDGNLTLGPYTDSESNLSVSGSIGVNGLIYGLEKGYVPITIDSNNYQGQVTVQLTKSYAQPPTIQLTPTSSALAESSRFDVCLLGTATTTSFTVLYRATLTYNPAAGFYWTAIP